MKELFQKNDVVRVKGPEAEQTLKVVDSYISEGIVYMTDDSVYGEDRLEKLYSPPPKIFHTDIRSRAALYIEDAADGGVFLSLVMSPLPEKNEAGQMLCTIAQTLGFRGRAYLTDTLNKMEQEINEAMAEIQGGIGDGSKLKN